MPIVLEGTVPTRKILSTNLILTLILTGNFFNKKIILATFFHTYLALQLICLFLEPA